MHNRHLLVYPLIGVGAGGMQYAITPTTSTSFGSILANPGRSARLSSGSMLFALRGGMTYMLSNRKTPGRGMALGVRVGYVINPFDPSWRESENTSVNGGPKLTSAGPELSISLGGWR